MSISKQTLCRRWVHSHEEDAEGQKVFRPADYPFPPSRGRLSFELSADGSARVRRPGATDRAVGSRGHWKLEDDVLELDTPRDATRRRVYAVVSSSPEKLVVRSTPSPTSSA
jgi:hypothetical protein